MHLHLKKINFFSVLVFVVITLLAIHTIEANPAQSAPVPSLIKRQPPIFNYAKNSANFNLDAKIAHIYELANPNHYDRAIFETNSAICEYQDVLYLVRLRAHLYAANREYANAIQDLSYLIIHSPNEPGLYIERGIILFKICQYRDAGRNAKRALYLDVTSVEAKELLLQANQKMHSK